MTSRYRLIDRVLVGLMAALMMVVLVDCQEHGIFDL